MSLEIKKLRAGRFELPTFRWRLIIDHPKPIPALSYNDLSSTAKSSTTSPIGIYPQD